MADNSKPPKNEYAIRPADFPNDRSVVHTLFAQYTNSLGIDLTYQDLSTELSTLPGKYTPSSRGALLVCSIPIIATSNSPTSHGQDNIVGCAALRNLPTRSDCCELKRLYILPEARGLGLGGKMLKRMVEEARDLGYKEMVLDTLKEMVEARRMYEKWGFEEIEGYYDSPVKGTVFMRLDLTCN